MRTPNSIGIETFEHEGYVEVRFSGPYVLGRFKKQMDATVLAFKEKGRVPLLVDIQKVTDFSPAAYEMFALGIHGAEIGRKFSKVAILIQDGQFDAAGFGALVAQNRGLRTRLHQDRQAAVEWLLT